MTTKQRLIFGCGYLGLPTGAGWTSTGDVVYGVTRKPERFSDLQMKGMLPLLGDVTAAESLNELPVADTVLIAIGMDRTTYSDIRAVYVEGLKNLLSKLPAETGHLIYISSTGVYGDSGGEWVNEETAPNPQREGGHACLEAEAIIKSSRFSNRFTILRFAGIYGVNRIPLQDAVKNQQWEKLNSSGHLNLIHVEDGARVIQAVAQNRPSGETYLVGDGKPVSRKHYYETVASHAGAGPIDWNAVNSRHQSSGRRSDKRIDNSKLCRDIEFEFQYPDYQAGLSNAFS